MSGIWSKHSRTSSSELDCVDVCQFVEIFVAVVELFEFVELFGVAVVDLLDTDLLAVNDNLLGVFANLFAAEVGAFETVSPLTRGLNPGLEPFAVLPTDIGVRTDEGDLAGVRLTILGPVLGILEADV